MWLLWEDAKNAKVFLEEGKFYFTRGEIVFVFRLRQKVKTNGEKFCNHSDRPVLFLRRGL